MATWQHLRSSTANKRPTTSLADGRIAINTNTASPGLFFKDSAGTGIVKVGPVHVGTTAPNATPAVGGSSGNYTGEQWLDTSASPAQMKVWNGSTWVGIVADELPVSKLQDGAARQLIQTDAAGTGVEWTSNVDVPGTLDVTSTATFDSIASHPLGSAGAPTITFTGDTNTGIYSPGADQVAISTGGSGRLFVDASGNVDIASSSQALTLLNLNASTTGNAAIRFSDTTANIGNINYSFTDDALTFRVNASERLRTTSAGRVGIGTSSPSELLHVASTGNTKLLVSSSFSGSTNTGLIVDTTGDTSIGSLSFLKAGVSRGDVAYRHNASGASERLSFNVAGGERLSVLGSGNVGVGTISPGGTLDIKAAASTAPLIVQGPSSEFARIDSSGRLLVGASSASSAGAYAQYGLVKIQGNSAASGGAAIVNIARGEGAATITSGEDLGAISFTDSAGNEFGTIVCAADSTAGASDYPGRLVFSTTADGASSPTERMRISNDGRHTINSNAHQGTALSTTAPANLYASTGTYTDTSTAASGTVTHGTIVAFDNPAIAASNLTVTYTNASTVYIDGAPTAGTNVTVTNPYALYVNAGTSFFGGNVNLSTGNEYRINNTKVVGARVTGWTAATGTATRTAFATSTVTTAQLAERVKALIDDLISHGLIGT